MTWSKREIIKGAFEEIGLGAFQYDLHPEDYQTALRRLNALVSEWSGAGAQTGYAGNNTPSTDDLDNDSNLPPDAVRGVICGLACDLAPGYGKQPTVKTMTAAQNGRNLMLAKSASDSIPRKQKNNYTVPAGAGHKFREQINLAAADTEELPGESA